MGTHILIIAFSLLTSTTFAMDKAKDGTPLPKQRDKEIAYLDFERESLFEVGKKWCLYLVSEYEAVIPDFCDTYLEDEEIDEDRIKYADEGDVKVYTFKNREAEAKQFVEAKGLLINSKNFFLRVYVKKVIKGVREVSANWGRLKYNQNNLRK